MGVDMEGVEEEEEQEVDVEEQAEEEQEEEEVEEVGVEEEGVDVDELEMVEAAQSLKKRRVFNNQDQPCITVIKFSMKYIATIKTEFSPEP